MTKHEKEGKLIEAFMLKEKIIIDKVRRTVLCIVTDCTNGEKYFRLDNHTTVKVAQ